MVDRLIANELEQMMLIKINYYKNYLYAMFSSHAKVFPTVDKQVESMRNLFKIRKTNKNEHGPLTGSLYFITLRRFRYFIDYKKSVYTIIFFAARLAENKRG